MFISCHGDGSFDHVTVIIESIAYNTFLSPKSDMDTVISSSADEDCVIQFKALVKVNKLTLSWDCFPRSKMNFDGLKHFG